MLDYLVIEGCVFYLYTSILVNLLVSFPCRYHGVWLITRCGLLSMSAFNIHNYKLCSLVLFMYGLFFRIVAFVAMIFLKKMLASVNLLLTDFFRKVQFCKG
jgi:Sec-independent protein secretion pathway component TatC